jgi:hypothetical protein
MDYQVITFDPNTGLASYGIPTPPAILTGMPLLVQVVVLSYLRNPGRSVLAPTEGSGLRGDIGKYNYSDTSGDEIQALCVQRTRAVQLEVVSRQDPSGGVPSERLSSLSVTNFAFDASTGQTLLGVKIINEAGDSTNILV